MISYVTSDDNYGEDDLGDKVPLELLQDYIHESSIKGHHSGDFPGSPELKNLPSSERDMGLIHCQGTKIPHASGQLSPHAPTTEFSAK